MVITWNLIFPSSLGAELEALKGDISKIKIRFPKLHDYSEGLVFFINQQIWNMPPGKNGLRQHQWKQEMMKKVADPPHCTLVYSEFHHKTIYRNNQLKQELIQELIEKMRQELKRPRGLPWSPKPASTKDNDHRSPALWWSLLVLIMELRKHGLEVGKSIYWNFIWSAAT